MAAGRFEWAGDDLAGGLDRLRRELGALGPVCGDDEAGRAFGAEHERARAGIEAAAARLAACAEGIGRGLRVMADAVERAEAASTISGAGGR